MPHNEMLKDNKLMILVLETIADSLRGKKTLEQWEFFGQMTTTLIDDTLHRVKPPADASAEG